MHLIQRIDLEKAPPQAGAPCYQLFVASEFHTLFSEEHTQIVFSIGFRWFRLFILSPASELSLTRRIKEPNCKKKINP